MPKSARQALDNFAGALVEDILQLSDEEILAEFREDHGDPEQHAAEMRALVERAVAMANEQKPSVGRVVHFVYGDQHYAAIITAAYSREIVHEDAGDKVTEGQTLIVFPPMDQPFSTVAQFDANGAPATWHWPEREG